MIDIIPGIGTQVKTVSEIEERVRPVAGLVEWVQIDVADNTLVPNTTFLALDTLGPLIKWGGTKNLSFEAHLMISEPQKYIRPLVDAGFGRIIAHVEAHDPRLFLDQAQYESVEVGLAIDGATEIEHIEPFLDAIDVVLVMTVEAGFSGAPFLPETIEKIKTIHQNLPDLPIEVDGGINDQTAKLVKEAGATRLVSTSFLYKDPANIAAAIDRLKNA